MANADVLIVNWSSGRRFLLQNDRSLVGTTCPDAASSFESSASSGKLNREGGNASASNKNRTQSSRAGSVTRTEGCQASCSQQEPILLVFLSLLSTTSTTRCDCIDSISCRHRKVLHLSLVHCPEWLLVAISSAWRCRRLSETARKNKEIYHLTRVSLDWFRSG